MDNETNKNCIIIHGSPPSPEHWKPVGDKKKWITWLRDMLSEKSIRTFVPNMPIPWQPIYVDWKQEFEKLPLNEESVLIGHSAGGAFLVRWLGENPRKIKKLILVAPGKKLGDYPNAEHNRELYDFEINPTIKNLTDEIIIFTSPEEPLHRQDNVAIYKKLLGAKVISLPGRGHYVYHDMHTAEFPEILQVVLEA